jgi:hypothetical protein
MLATVFPALMTLVFGVVVAQTARNRLRPSPAAMRLFSRQDLPAIVRNLPFSLLVAAPIAVMGWALAAVYSSPLAASWDSATRGPAIATAIGLLLLSSGLIPVLGYSPPGWLRSRRFLEEARQLGVVVPTPDWFDKVFLVLGAVGTVAGTCLATWGAVIHPAGLLQG